MGAGKVAGLNLRGQVQDELQVDLLTGGQIILLLFFAAFYLYFLLHTCKYRCSRDSRTRGAAYEPIQDALPLASLPLSSPQNASCETNIIVAPVNHANSSHPRIDIKNELSKSEISPTPPYSPRGAEIDSLLNEDLPPPYPSPEINHSQNNVRSKPRLTLEEASVNLVVHAHNV